MNQAFDLLLLLFNLSQLHNREKIIQLFVEGMQEIFLPAEFKYREKKEAGQGTFFEIRTRKSSFGFINANLTLEGDDASNILIINAVQMLAVSLENLDFEQKLEKERNQFEEISINKFAEAERSIKDLEEAKRASLNLIEDLTEEIEKRTSAEKALRESEEKFRRVFEDGKFGMGLVDKNFRFIQVNEAFCGFIGYSAKELLSMTFKDITHAEHVSADVDWVKKIYEGSIPFYRTEKRYITKDGKIVWGAVNINAIRDAENTFLYFLAMIDDITEKKSTDLALKENEEKFRNLFEHSPVGKSMTKVDGTLSVNRAFCNILGYSEDELKSKNWKDISHPDDITMTDKLVKSLIAGESDSARFEKRYLHKNGNTIFTDVATYLQRNTDGSPQYFITTINDISDRKIAEIKLREEKERIRTILDLVGDPIFVKDNDHRIILANQAFYDIFCLDENSVIGYTLVEAVPENERYQFLEVDRRVLDTGIPDQREEELTVKELTRTIITRKTRFIDESGARFLVGSIHDITDRKLAEELVLQEKKFNQAAIDSLPGLFYLFDEQGHYLRWNKNYEEVSGYSAEEVAGMSPLDYFTEPDKSEIATAIQQVWTTGNTLVEGKFTSKNRTQKHYFFTGKLFWFDGKRCLIGMGIDITHRKKAEEEIRKLNAELEQRVLERTNLLARSNNLLVETGRLARVGGWEIDLVTGKLFWSDATYKIHEVEPGFEPSMDTAINFYAPDAIPIISECIDRLINLGEPFDKELEFITAKKNRLWVRAIGEAYRENGKVVKIGGVFQDINERKLADEELKRRSVQLEESNKELEAFSYSVSHDLRAPLRAIHSFTTILREDCEDVLGDEGKRICGIIESSSVHMGQLIDDLLSFSRIGRTELKLSKIDMTQLAKSVYIESGDEKLKEKIYLVIRKLPSAHGDFSTVKQVFVNLISNAIKYTSKTEKPSILIGSDKASGEVVYFVKDNGVGFDMQYVNKLYGVFQRLHSTKDFEGNGVGLAIVQRIIHRHGGRVWAEGEVGKGATFFFTLPDKDK